MQLKNLLSTLFLILSISGYAQQLYYNQRPEFLNANRTWAFGGNAGLDFSSGSPTAIQTSIVGKEGYAAVSDPLTGKLLFYSNGKDCWNSTGQRMPNGGNLFGNGSGNRGGSSTAQGVCIVPCIDTPSKYYLFSLMGKTNYGDSISYARGVLYYSVIHMALDSGRGDIESNRKNIVLDRDTLGEGMIAIPGDNCDIWLIVHAIRKPEFKAYHITHDGLDPKPIISATGFAMQGDDAYGLGTMAISPDRKKILIANNSYVANPNSKGVLIGQFNAATGQVSNAFQILPGILSGGASSACFSPDNSRLYVRVLNGGYSLNQFDVSIWDSATITNSITNIIKANSLPSHFRLYNDTIYADNGNGSYLRRINNPNLAGIACNYEDNAVPLAPMTRCFLGLGNDVVYPMPLDTVYQKILDVTACPEQSQILKPKLPAYSGYRWNDGSVEQAITVKGPGNYWVSYNENMCQRRIDTFVLHEEKLSPIITVNKKELSTTITYTTYQWLLKGMEIPGANQSTYIVDQNGDYQVIVSNEMGCVDTSAIYKVTNFEETDISDIGVSKASVRVYPNPAQDILYVTAPAKICLTLLSMEGKVLEQNIKTKQVNLQGRAKGVYFLKISDQYGRLVTVEKIVKAW